MVSLPESKVPVHQSPLLPYPSTPKPAWPPDPRPMMSAVAGVYVHVCP
jgi:hypothetical protein